MDHRTKEHIAILSHLIYWNEWRVNGGWLAGVKIAQLLVERTLAEELIPVWMGNLLDLAAEYPDTNSHFVKGG